MTLTDDQIIKLWRECDGSDWSDRFPESEQPPCEISKHDLLALSRSLIEQAQREQRERQDAEIAESCSPRHTECGDKIAHMIRKAPHA